MTYDPNTPPTNAQPPAYTPPAAPPAAPAAPASAVTPAGSKTLGLIAFGASVVGVIAGAIIAYIAGQQGGAIVEYTGTSGTTTNLPPAAEQIAIQSATVMLLAFAVYGVLGLWGFIQGIIATVKKRGRGWGITAIVVAVVGGGIVGIAYGAGIAAGAAPYLATLS